MLLFALIVIALWREAGEAVTREERGKSLTPRPA
jgi:hypothetical protein